MPMSREAWSTKAGGDLVRLKRMDEVGASLGSRLHISRAEARSYRGLVRLASTRLGQASQLRQRGFDARVPG